MHRVRWVGGRAVTPRVRVVFERAIEEGIAYGLTRAFKHTTMPTREELSDAIEIAVMGSIDEVFAFEKDADAE